MNGDLFSHRFTTSIPVESVRNIMSQKLWVATIEEMRLENALSSDLASTLTRWIVHGVDLDFISLPKPMDLPNTPSVAQHPEVVRECIKKYIAFGALDVLPSSFVPTKGIAPVHVVVLEGKKPRLVVDLSINLNGFLKYEYFPYVSVAEAASAARELCFFAKLDVTNCFLSFPLNPSVMDYFVIKIENELMRFNSVPFGLGPAPRIITLLLSVVKWKTAKMFGNVSWFEIFPYLDDSLYQSQTFKECLRLLHAARATFKAFGLSINESKTEGPAREITFLGIVLNSTERTLSLSVTRLSELKSSLRALLETQHVSNKALSSLIGKLSFASQVLPGARPFTRRMLDLLSSLEPVGVGKTRVKFGVIQDKSLLRPQKSGAVRPLLHAPWFRAAADKSSNSYVDEINTSYRGEEMDEGADSYGDEGRDEGADSYGEEEVDVEADSYGDEERDEERIWDSVDSRRVRASSFARGSVKVNRFQHSWELAPNHSSEHVAPDQAMRSFARNTSHSRQSFEHSAPVGMTRSLAVLSDTSSKQVSPSSSVEHCSPSPSTGHSISVEPCAPFPLTEVCRSKVSNFKLGGNMRIASSSRAKVKTGSSTATVFHRLYSGFRDDALFWLDYLTNWNGSKRWRTISNDPVVFVSDASTKGFGFYVEKLPSHLDTSHWPVNLAIGSAFSGSFSIEDQAQCGNSRNIAFNELLAVWAELSIYAHLLIDQSVCVVIDNQTDSAIINKQATSSAALAPLLRAIYKLAADFNFTLFAVHRAGEENDLADLLSRPDRHLNDPLLTWSNTNNSRSFPVKFVSFIYSRPFVMKLIGV